MKKSSKILSKPFAITAIYSICIVFLVLITFVFNKAFAGVLLICNLPMILFFLFRDIKRSRELKNQ